MTRPRPPRTRAPLAAVAALVLGLSTAAPAHAATFQYWGYYQLTDGAWVFAQKGSGETNPADGSVEGWRWAITEESGTPPRTPRVTPTFGQVCDATGAQSGMKRVAVVLDYGRAVDGDGDVRRRRTWSAECAVVPTAATGAEVLAAVAAVRNGTTGLVCGINDYPATGCGGAVASLTDEQKAADTPVTLAATASASAQTQPPVGPDARRDTVLTHGDRRAADRTGTTRRLERFGRPGRRLGRPGDPAARRRRPRVGGPASAARRSDPLSNRVRPAGSAPGRTAA